jgi:short-subunit dehydrogenase
LERTGKNFMTAIQGRGTALITGASAGIGAVYAERLARRGFDLVLVARNQERLTMLSQQLSAATGRKIETLVADLCNKKDVARVEASIRANRDLKMLVNNAGVGAAATLLASDIEKMEAMIDLNVNAVTRLAYAAAPGFVARGHGTIVNISSIVAVSPETLNGVYGGTKAFVLAFSQSLQHELGDKGVRIQAVLPGATATEFWDVAGYPIDRLPAGVVMSASDLVDAALSGLDLGEKVTIPSLPDQREWDDYDAARRAMAERISRSTPATRYGVRLQTAPSV